MLIKCILPFLLLSLIGCTDGSAMEENRKIQESIESNLAIIPTYSNNIYQECMKLPGLGWDPSAAAKCECVKNRVRPNMEMVFENAKATAKGSYASFQSLEWEELLGEKVTEQSFKDCGFRY